MAYLDADDPIPEVRGYAQPGAAHSDSFVTGRDAQPAALCTALAAPVITAARPRGATRAADPITPPGPSA